MSMIVKNEGGSSIPLLEEGVYTAVCTGLIDLGFQKSTLFNKNSRKVQVMWTIPSEKVKYTDKEGNEKEGMRQMSKEYTACITEKSNLNKDLTSWRGKAFTEEEMKGFDLKKLLLVPCQIQIIHQGKENKYASIAGIMSLPKGMKVDTSELTATIFDMSDVNTWNVYETLPKFIQEKIKGSVGFAESDLDNYIRGLAPVEEEKVEEKAETTKNYKEVTEDDLPF